jgi:hypothetical protein
LGEYEAVDASNESMVNSNENSLVVSSPYCDGQNIFYSSHNRLYNSQHEYLLNGTFMGHSSVADGLAACYMGNNKYLFFSVTTSYEEGARGLKAYVVDMNEDNGRGALVDSVVIEAASHGIAESIELLAKDGTSNQYWLVYADCNGSCAGENNNRLRVRPIDVSKPFGAGTGYMIESVSHTTTKTASRTFTMKASQQHDRIAVTDWDSHEIELFDFDVSTGTLSHRLTHDVGGDLYGLEFSPDGNQIYVARYYGAQAELYQYEISSSSVIAGSHIPYWTQTTYNSKGGGLKLGPDNKIYVMLYNSNKVGAISHPNDTTNLSSRYDGNTLQLGVTYDGLQFSTGLTKPSLMACNINNAPVTQTDSTNFCVSGTSRRVAIDVLTNDNDLDGDAIYVMEAHFVNILDTTLAMLSVNATSDSVILIVKPNANIPNAGYLFEIIYDVKDNGLPASQCASGLLNVQTYKVSVADDITVADTSICYGTSVTLTPSTTDIINPEYKWYISQTENTPFHTGATYTTPALTTDTTFYISISGDNYCENDTGNRKAVRVRIHPLPTFVVVTDTTICTTINLSDLIGSISANAVIRFYRDVQGDYLLPSPRVDVLSDTLYYVRAVDIATGCMSAIQTINIHQGVYPAESPITGKTTICIDETVTLSNAATEGGIWSLSNTSIAEIVTQSAKSVDIKGKTTGTVYVSYTIGNIANCQTRVTFQLKVIPSTPPEIIIGRER